MKTHKVKNKILHIARTPMCRSRVFTDKKKEAKKNGKSTENNL